MPQDLTDAEFDQLGDLLDAAPAPSQALDVLMLDGYLVGTLVLPRRLERDEWLPPVFGFDESALPADADPEWLDRTTALIERRRDALNAAIGEHGWFDPMIADVDQMPPASEYEPIQSPIARALAPWVAGFFWALECFPELTAQDDAAIDLALARLLRHLPPEDDEQRALFASLDRQRPLNDIDTAVQDLVEAAVELWDLTSKQRFQVPTLRREAPKVGRNDPCPCGSGKKFKHCHGST